MNRERVGKTTKSDPLPFARQRKTTQNVVNCVGMRRVMRPGVGRKGQGGSSPPRMSRPTASL